MHQIHIYLDSHDDLLSKKIIFFTQHEINHHWWGWVAINPWYHIIQILQSREKKKDSKKKKKSNEDEDVKYVCGLLACDGIETRMVKHSFDVIWFLNLASAYRDMMAEDLYGKFVLENHTPESYWLMGCCGPFGILDKDLLGKITFLFLKIDSRL